MATNSSADVLPVLPPEIWRLIVIQFQWIEEFDIYHYAWTKLRLVCHLFKETVERFWPLGHIRHLKLRVTYHFLCCSPARDLSEELIGTCDKLSADGTMAIFQLTKPDWSKVDLERYGPSAAIDVIEQNHPFEVLRDECLRKIVSNELSVMVGKLNWIRIPERIDLDTKELSIPTRHLYDSYFSHMKLDWEPPTTSRVYKHSGSWLKEEVVASLLVWGFDPLYEFSKEIAFWL